MSVNCRYSTPVLTARSRRSTGSPNKLHVDTRDQVIESQLLFKAGEPVSERLIEETERNLRELRYIREPVDKRDRLP